jgi:DNA replication licensing factor MCM7
MYTRRHYIALARQKRPTVPAAVSAYIVESYVRLRKLSKDEEKEHKSHTYTSARTLLGVLRLAQALARLRFADDVSMEDVDEALRLMEKSKESLMEDGARERETDQTDTSKIYRLIKDMATAMGVGAGKRRKTKMLGKRPGATRRVVDEEESEEDEAEQEISIVDIRARTQLAGFTETQLMDTILEVCFITYHPLTLTNLVPQSVRRH